MSSSSNSSKQTASQLGVEKIGQTLIDSFKNKDALPAALSNLFLKGNKGLHSDSYSWTNRFIVAINGYTDAAGYKQWLAMGRQVQAGQKCFWIFKPIIISVDRKNPETQQVERIKIPRGFGGVGVFGLEQTKVFDEELWKKHQPESSESKKFLDELPLRNVAEKWGITLTAYNGEDGKALGWYRSASKTIALGVANLSTFAHELIHAADDKLGNISANSDRQKDEIVAELGGAILLHAMGYERESDLGGAWNYINSWSKAEGNADKMVRACNSVLNRTCKCVSLILEEAGLIETKTTQEVQTEELAAA